MVHQELHDVQVACRGGLGQRCAPELDRGRAGLCAGFQKHPHDRSVSTLNGGHQRQKVDPAAGLIRVAPGVQGRLYLVRLSCQHSHIEICVRRTAGGVTHSKQ